MAMQMSLDDHRTLQAIGILADALDGVSGAGVIDTVLVSKALRQVLATRSRPAFDFASRAFSTLDPEVKRQVAADADNRAREHVRRQSEETLPAGVRSAAVAAPTGRPPVARSATGILAALNNRGRTPTPRRGADEDGSDEGA
jgi:hypothetical protein